MGGCKIVDSRVFPIWSLIHGSSWSGLIKAEPGLFLHNQSINGSKLIGWLRNRSTPVTRLYPMKAHCTFQMKTILSLACESTNFLSWRRFRFITYPLRWVCNGSNNSNFRIIWTIILVVGLLAFAKQMIDSIIYYRSWPVAVNVKINYNDTLTFPAITICNQNAFR